MWSFRSVICVWCFLLLATITALPTSTKRENDATQPPKAETAILELIELPSEKPADNSKPNEMAVDPKPTIEVKPTEQTKPESFGSTATIFESIPLNVGGSPPRRQLFYDQRQDGKYNIRADLENFVILVVPSSGNSLLDLLKRSNQRPHKRTHNSKHHHKKYVSGGSTKPVEVTSKKQIASRLDYLNRPETEEHAGGEFIEGRTPYHVDISSAEILQPSAFGSIGDERSLNGDAPTIADIPLQLNNADPSIDSNSTPILITTLKV